MSGAAKNVAQELETPHLIGHQADPRDPIWDDVDPDLEIGHAEAHKDIGRGEFQYDGDTFLQRELIWGVGEPPGQDLDDLLLGLRGGV